MIEEGILVFPNLRFAVKRMVAADASCRVPRAQQSQAAFDLLRTLEDDDIFTARSRAHSRTVVAVAVGRGNIDALGIDVEYRDPGRRIREATGFLGWNIVPNINTFYRAWTFAEAWFKAFEVWPDSKLIADLLSRDESPSSVQLGDRVGLLERRVYDDFSLAIVWRTAKTVPNPPASLG